MPRATQTETYWRNEFKFTAEDETDLQEHFFLQNKPLSTEQISRLLMDWRLAEDKAVSAKYSPTEQYKVGEKIIFDALDDDIGEVMAIRDGENERYGSFRVIKVYFAEYDETREYSSELDPSRFEIQLTDEPNNEPLLSPEELYANFGSIVLNTIQEALNKSPHFVPWGNHWISTIILVPYNQGHLHIADAMIDIMGSAMPTTELLREIPLEGKYAQEIKEFSLNYMLSQDTRFKNVGTQSEPLWYLLRLT